MTLKHQERSRHGGITRRDLLLVGAVGAAIGAGLLSMPKRYFRLQQQALAFVAKVDHYQSDIAHSVRRGLVELGIAPDVVKGKRILLKPNLVETASGALH